MSNDADVLRAGNLEVISHFCRVCNRSGYLCSGLSVIQSPSSPCVTIPVMQVNPFFLYLIRACWPGCQSALFLSALAARCRRQSERLSLLILPLAIYVISLFQGFILHRRKRLDSLACRAFPLQRDLHVPVASAR